MRRGTDTPKRLFERSSAASLVGTQLKSSAPPERTAADYGLGRRTSVDHLGRHNTWMSDDGELNASGLPMAGHELPAEMLEDIKEAIGHQGARRIEAAFAKVDPSKQGRLCPADFVAVLNSLREPDMSSITPAMLWGAANLACEGWLFYLQRTFKPTGNLATIRLRRIAPPAIFGCLWATMATLSAN